MVLWQKSHCRFPFTSTFNYDWYDGTTAGIAIDSRGSPVVFRKIEGTIETQSFLLAPITRHDYDAVVARYGTPEPDSSGRNCDRVG